MIFRQIDAIRYYGKQVLPALFQRIVIKFWGSERIHGIRIVDPDPVTNLVYTARVCGALDLLAAKHERRFSIVCRELSTIVNMPMPGGSSYARLARICHLDHKLYASAATEEVAEKMIACHLVYYAALGRIHRYGVIPDLSNLNRCHSISNVEMCRFASRLGIDPKPLEVQWHGQPLTASEKRVLIEQASRDYGDHLKIESDRRKK